MEKIAKVSSQLITASQATELKLKNQHYVIIIPLRLIEKLGIFSEEIDFDLVIDNSNKLALIGPKLGSQPKSVSPDHERGGFVI